MMQATLADMAADVEAARLLVYQRGLAQRSAASPPRKATSIAKLFATEAAVRAASEAVLLHGNRGYSNEYPVERYYRDIKGLQIYEGTSHIQRIIIARELVGRDEHLVKLTLSHGLARLALRRAADIVQIAIDRRAAMAYSEYWNPKNETLPREELAAAATGQAAAACASGPTPTAPSTSGAGTRRASTPTSSRRWTTCAASPS